MSWIRSGTKSTCCGHCLAIAKSHTARSNTSSARDLLPDGFPTSLKSEPSRHFSTTSCRTASSPEGSNSQVRRMSTPAAAQVQKRALDRDVIVSVLEASATRRDAKNYLQKFHGKGRSDKSPKPTQDAQNQLDNVSQPQEAPHVAITKLRHPQHLDDDTIFGVAKTLVQLRVLGLLSVVVVDCGSEAGRQVAEDQSVRLCEAIDSYGKPAAKVLSNIVMDQARHDASKPSFVSDSMLVEDRGLLQRSLRHGLIPVVPSLASRDEISSPQPTDSHNVVMALTRYFTGLQFNAEGNKPSEDGSESHAERPTKIATVERVIILDPLGGTPVTGRPGASHRFVNLDQEYDSLLKHLMGPEGSPVATNVHTTPGPSTTHAANLSLARNALSVLPPSASALITTPWAAANTTLRAAGSSRVPSEVQSSLGYNDMVTTRKRQNPLLHNLLTDKPVYSSSLPVQRVHDGGKDNSYADPASAATLVKRGMPLTIFPDARINRWSPPKPGAPRLRLTDTCVDLPRLIYLIEDSFNRKLDVKDYLDRVNENLAGIIIAGEYEGGAILTWERPPGLSREEAYETGRMIPYLDKFAVLKSRQGSGGVADIVFNAMVRDCFPDGVCWRSRKDNPVNKWYFERSAGTNKLSNSNWSMFWTTLGLSGQHPTLLDYEAVCRAVEPSWADNKHNLD